MVLPLIPLAIIAAAGGTAVLGSAVTSFFSAQGKKGEVNSILENPNVNSENIADVVAANRGTFSDSSPVVGSKSETFNDQSTSSYVDNRSWNYITESPNASVSTIPSTSTTQTPQYTNTSSGGSPWDTLASGLVGSVVPLGLLLIGGVFLLKSVGGSK